MGNMFGFSPLITRVAPTNTLGNTVFAGEIIRVWGFTVSNISGGTVTATLTTNETSPTTLWTATVPTNTTVSIPIPFIADRGLQVISSTGSTLSFTFYHSQVGT